VGIPWNCLETGFRRADFVYLFLEHTNRFPIQIVLTDLTGNSVRATDKPSAADRSQISFWPAQDSDVRWLPGASSPRHGTAVKVADWLTEEERVLIVSVHDLARAKLDVRRISSAVLEANVTNATSLALSPVYVLARDGPFVFEDEAKLWISRTVTHRNGLGVLEKSFTDRTEKEALAGLQGRFTAKFNGLPSRSDE
jgi:hypothetical protein